MTSEIIIMNTDVIALAADSTITIRRWDAKFNEFLFLEKFMFVSYFLVIFHDYFIIDSF